LQTCLCWLGLGPGRTINGLWFVFLIYIATKEAKNLALEQCCEIF